MADESPPIEQPHISFEREPDVERERRRSGRIIPHVPNRDRASHGKIVQHEVARAVSNVTARREALGIAIDQLLVVEFQSWDHNCRSVLEQRFSASVVNERVEANGAGRMLTRVLVQFPTTQSISQIHAEADEYRRDTNVDTDFPPGVRRTFFDCLESVRSVSREDRMGIRLAHEGFPDEEPFYIDVDLWHPGSDHQARAALQELRQLCSMNDGSVKEDLRTSSLVLARVEVGRKLADELLDLDLVAQVDLPPVLPTVYEAVLDDPEPPTIQVQPSGTEPTVAVLDSGVLTAHPLLRGWVVDEMDFDSGENTPYDRHGHGTQVAGLAAYGSVARCMDTGVWAPQVLIASAKVLRCHPQDQRQTMFPDNHRPEALVERAIRHYHATRQCRVFNLSAGSRHDVYSGGRQFAWAEVLDRLARELDIIIVVSAGNIPDPYIPNAYTRQEFQERVRDSLLSDPAARLCNPATSAIAVTVGSIARSDRPRTLDTIAGSPKGAPAPFSRVGPGYENKDTQRAVKPEFVAYGGNYAVRSLAGRPSWVETDLYLGEPTTRLNVDGGRLLTAVSGTSFAAPQISTAAAIAFESASSTLGTVSANVARAILGVSAATPACGDSWLLDTAGDQTWEKLRLAGYGVVDMDRVRASADNDVCLVASDQLADDHWHIYAVPVPPSFMEGRGRRGISVSLAFDPPVRSSRKEYLSRTMWIEVFKGLEMSEVIHYRARYARSSKEPSLPQSKILDMRPPKTELQWSTLQVRRKTWSSRPRFPVVEGNDVALLHVLIGCQRRFPHGEESTQGYGVAFRFWHTDAQVDLYQQIRTRVRPRVVLQTRAAGA